MAATGYTPISLYYSTTASATPLAANLVAGELALNTLDEKLYFKNSAGTVKLLAQSAASSPVTSFQTSLSGLTPSTSTTGAITLAGTLNPSSGGTGLTSLTAGYIPFGAGTSAFGSSSNLFWDSINGRLGIGTSSPTAPLSASISSAASSPTLVIGNTDLTAGGAVRANFLSGDDGTVGRTRAIIEAASDGANNGRIAFYTRNAGANTEKLRIASTGAVSFGSVSTNYGTAGQVLTSAGNAPPTWTTPTTGTVTSVSVTSANGFAGTVATSTTTPAITLSTTVTGVLKGNGTAISAAVSGTDYAPATSGSSILYGDGAGGFSNVTIGTGISFAAGTLSATGSGGTVTSVSWTGGIVSVATATTTPAFTIAGTSGGIPYFSSASTWASSAALAANALVVGGGAGVAPATVTTGTGVVTALGVNTGTAGAFVVNGGALGTPSSGTLTSCTGLPLTTGVTGTLPVANGGTGLTAGTSGGIPYYSSASAITSSAALAANAIVLGGGAGAAPATTTTGTGVVTAIGNAVNTTNGLVTQTATLTASALLLGGGSGTGISSTTTGAGVVTALGVATNATGGFPTINGTATLTNKRTDPRVVSAASASSLTPSIATADIYAYTALAANLTINAPTGTPVDGNKLIFRLLDNGVARTLTWNATFTAIGVTLPTTTTASKMTYVGCIYNAANTRWDVVAVTTQA